VDFEIPEDISRYSVEGLRQFAAEALTEYNALMASVDTNNPSQENLDRLTALRSFSAGVEAEITGRADRAAAFAAEQAAFAASTEVVEPVVETATEATPSETVVEAVTASAQTQATTTLTIADVAGDGSVTNQSTGTRTAGLPNYTSLVAATDVPGFVSSAPLDDMTAIAKAFIARTAGYSAMRGSTQVASHGVAVFNREYPAELTVQQNDGDEAVIANAVNEFNLAGGSLVAASSISRKAAVEKTQSLTAAIGWCSPSITMYDTCLQVTTDGLAQFPEVQAPRGGIKHNSGITWSGIYNDGTGFFNYTEAQIIAGVTKPCVVVDCPAFVDTRLGVTGLCITGNILQNRAYPEYVATFIRGALAASAHQINMLQIASVVTQSTAVDLTTSASFIGDGTVVSQLYSAIDLAIMDEKYALRLGMSSTIELILPFWVLAQMRADWIRRNATSDPNLADAVISAWFAARDAAPQFVYDWQDAFSAAGVGPGATAAITALPTSLVFLAYPAGTWVRAVSDVITLNSIYDSTKLAANQVTQLFTEQGWAMAKMCPLSRAYTLNICPSGESGAQRVSSNTIAC
jgi:hypothetical protein